jgi:hypothetical protein
MTRTHISAALAAALLFALPASAQMTSCTLDYSVRGWSFLYKRYTGSGTVTCQNGQAAGVRISIHGGGFTIGKSEIDDGLGRFTEVRDISEVFGTYVAVAASAGATRSAEGQVMTKGEVSLVLSGTGRGFDLGVTLGSFAIEPR